MVSFNIESRKGGLIQTLLLMFPNTFFQVALYLISRAQIDQIGPSRPKYTFFRIDLLILSLSTQFPGFVWSKPHLPTLFGYKL